MKQYPYTSIFATSPVKCVTDKEKDELLALASLEQLRKFIPEGSNDNGSFLPIAFNICVANRINLNDDVIDTQTAIAIYKKFINTPSNIEHNRKNVVGVTLIAGFSEFGTDKPLTEEEVKDYKKPFNVTLGGVIWKVVNPELAELIQESNDPSSPNYMSYSSSWELGFTDYKLVTLPVGEKNIEKGKIISDASELEKFKPKLRALGGEGKIDGMRVYRMPSVEVEPLGVGFTEKPAAEVKGIATEKPKEKEVEACASEHYIEKCSCGEQIGSCRCNSPNKKIIVIEAGCPKCKNNISQAEKTNVKKERQVFMKFNSIADITDESLKTANAANIAEFLAEQIRNKSTEFEKDKGALNKKIEDAESIAKKNKEELDKNKEELNKVTVTLSEVQKSLAEFEKKEQDRAKVEKFNARMTEIDEAYELDEEVKAAILDDVKAIQTDEDFNKWKLKAAALFKPFKKGKKEDDKKGAKDKKDDKSCASASVDDAIDKGDKQKDGVTNTSSASSQTMKEKFASAFALDQFEIKVK